MNLSGDSGTTETFTLTAGNYATNLQIQYDPTNDPSGSGQCLFSGELDNLTTGNSVTLGGNGPVEVTAGVPIENAVNGYYNSGTFRLTIYPQTNCDWDFTIVTSNGG